MSPPNGVPTPLGSGSRRTGWQLDFRVKFVIDLRTSMNKRGPDGGREGRAPARPSRKWSKERSIFFITIPKVELVLDPPSMIAGSTPRLSFSLL